MPYQYRIIPFQAISVLRQIDVKPKSLETECHSFMSANLILQFTHYLTSPVTTHPVIKVDLAPLSKTPSQ